MKILDGASKERCASEVGGASVRVELRRKPTDIPDAARWSSGPAVAADFLSETSPIFCDQHIGSDRCAPRLWHNFAQFSRVGLSVLRKYRAVVTRARGRPSHFFSASEPS